MTKPPTIDGFDTEVTTNCERVLVTLIRGLGPWRDSIFLVGGLTPRYLIKKRPPQVPAHAGTGDVDIVIQLHILTTTEAYHSLEDNLKKIGFKRGTNTAGKPVNWRWVVEVRSGMSVTLELLADDPKQQGGRITELPTEGNVSALHVPYSAIVFDHHKEETVRAELLGENGIGEIKLRYADLVAFTCLKAIAIDNRDERKDSHDVVYCLTHYEGGVDAAAAEFRAAKGGKHASVIERSLEILARDFADDQKTEGYLKVGPVAVAKFELGEDEAAQEARALRQRDIADLIGRFLNSGLPTSQHSGLIPLGRWRAIA